MDDASPTRLEAIKALPDQMQDHALVDWETTAALMNVCVPWARKLLKENQVPLVELSERKRQPRWGTLREFMSKRETFPSTPK